MLRFLRPPSYLSVDAGVEVVIVQLEYRIGRVVEGIGEGGGGKEAEGEEEEKGGEWKGEERGGPTPTCPARTTHRLTTARTGFNVF